METKTLDIYQAQSAPVIQRANEINITNKETLKRAVEDLSIINKVLDGVEADREKLTKPINKALKEIRERYKPIVEVLEEARDVLRKKMGTYQTEALKSQQDAQEKITGRVGEGKGKFKVETAIKKLGEVEEVDKSIEGEVGDVTFVTVKKFEVTDMAKLPLKFHLPNETEIRRLMTSGIEVEGVRYWEEQSVRNSR